MFNLPPWARGPFELLQHAELHYVKNNDIDRRIALIGFDNTIEVAITTYLQLNPQLRSGREYQKNDIQLWLRNYHTKIKFFFEKFLIENNSKPDVTIEEIIWYHTIRNELYHSGNGVVPEKYCLDGVRNAAIEIMELLFNVDIKGLLSLPQRISTPTETREIITNRNLFLQTFILLERTIISSVLTIGLNIDHSKKSGNPFIIWSALKEQLGEKIVNYERLVKEAIKVRNELINDGMISCSDANLSLLISKLNELIRYLQSYGFSLNILDELKERYGDWVDTDITNLRIVQKKGSAFLEVSRNTNSYDEEIKRVNLDFIIEDIEEDERLFSTISSAQHNAERFFDQLDLYSIVMTGIGDVLFTAEGIEEAAEYCGADKGEPRGEYTSRKIN